MINALIFKIKDLAKYYLYYLNKNQGLNSINELTRKIPTTLRIELTNFEDETRWAEYRFDVKTVFIHFFS